MIYISNQHIRVRRANKHCPFKTPMIISEIDKLSLVSSRRFISYTKMADNSQTVVKTARVLAIAHIGVGALLFLFGIADRFTSGFTGYIYFGVWIGFWMCITGGLGICGSRREKTRSRDAFAAVFMGFSITSVTMAGVIIILYGLVLGFRDRYDTKMAIVTVILVLGIAEFVIGIWAAICCCMMNPCACCTKQQGQQVVYTANAPGYVVIQGPDGNPVAVPMQAVDGVVSAQESNTQESRSPMVLVPASGVIGGLPLTGQAAPSYAEPATGYPPQQAEMPPPYEHGQYTPLNEEEQQMPRSFSTADYAITPTTVGGPVSVPVQAGGDMFAVRESRDQGGQPPEVLVPVSEATKEQLNFNNAAPVVEMQSTGYPSPQVSETLTIAYV